MKGKLICAIIAIAIIISAYLAISATNSELEQVNSQIRLYENDVDMSFRIFMIQQLNERKSVLNQQLNFILGLTICLLVIVGILAIKT